jgi:hypothetical protein
MLAPSTMAQSTQVPSTYFKPYFLIKRAFMEPLGLIVHQHPELGKMLNLEDLMGQWKGNNAGV